MEWNFLFAVIINFQVIYGITCQWPFSNYPPPPQPPPLHHGVWEEHYMKIRMPQFAPKVPFPAQTHPIVEPETLSDDILFSVNHMHPSPVAEPDDFHYISPRFNFNGHEYVEYSQEDPSFKIQKENTRYRKTKNSGLLNPLIRNHHQGSNRHPKRFRPFNQPKIEADKKLHPTTFNDKFPDPPKKVVVLEEESFHNKKHHKSKYNGISSLESNSPISTESTRIPIEVTSYSMQSPDGAVTQVTEMLYDVTNDQMKEPTTTPVINPFLPPSTSVIYTPTDDPNDPNVTPVPVRGTTQSQESVGISSPYGDRPVTTKFDDTTSSPVTVWPAHRHLPTPPPYKGGGASVRISTASSESGPRRYRKRLSTSKPPSTTNKNLMRDNGPSLSAAAIAGIIMGSLVSIVLLAGAALFVMYKSPFRRSRTPSEPDPIPVPSGGFIETTGIPSESNHPRIYRWPPRRLRRQNPSNNL